MATEMEHEAVILVTRGDEMPKKNYEKKLHPTYETSIRIKNTDTTAHVVVKFFDQYRALYNDLVKEGVGENLAVHIDAKFPPSQKSSVLGLSMSEDALQQRCYLLNKWMGTVFASYYLFPPAAQKAMSDFLSLNDEDAKLERNKELILELIQKKKVEKKIEPPAPLVTAASRAGPITQPIQHTPFSSPSPPPPAPAQSTPSRNETPPPAAPVVLQLSVPSPGEKDSGKTRRSSMFGGSVAGDALSEDEIQLLSKETPFSTFLAVRVTAGEMLPKSPEESKLHRSYELVIRVLALDEVNMPYKETVDPEAYSAHHVHMPRIRVAKAFDAYRTLKTHLEAAKVAFRDSPAAVSADSSAVLVDAAFPKTYSKLTMGMGLSETQFAQRVAVLNEWVGKLMQAYSRLPAQAQTIVNTFLSLGASIPTDAQYEVFTKMITNTFVPAKKGENGEAHSAAASTGGGMFGRFGKQPSGGHTPVSPASYADEEGEVEPVSYSRASVASVAFNPAELTEFSKATLVHGFLTVSVTMGRALPKKEGETKAHHAYETAVQIVPLFHLTVDTASIDAEQYDKLAAFPHKSAMMVFDGYRTLKANLQEAHVYSRDTAHLAVKDPKAIFLDAPFPKTYPKSKLGIGLTESELQTRVSVLNHWMGQVLLHFHRMSEEAQDKVVAFLSLEEDNPAEPQNRVMQAMLRNSYSPPLKKGAVAAKGGKAASKASAATTSAASSGQAEDREPGDNSAQPAGHAKGCGCTIM